MNRTRRRRHHQDDEYDSLAYDPEFPETYIPDCPWMHTVKHDIGFDTIYSQASAAGDLNYIDINNGHVYFRYHHVPVGEDFKKRNCFVYLPNRLYNQQII